MEYQNINNTLIDGEIVTSTYAEVFLNDIPSTNKIIEDDIHIEHKLIQNVNQVWTSPSDLLIDIIKLNPPFTSKITRGKTHEGILTIGSKVLERERTNFLKLLTKLLKDNDASWNLILAHEKNEVTKKVKTIFHDIFKYKSDIMKREISMFYESSLQDLENHLKAEMQITLQTAYANTISDLNRQIQQKLQKEKQVLEAILQKKFTVEIEKMKKYYSLLLHNENYRNNKLVNQAMQERNNALKVFYENIEAERITSTMYVMSLERKKCRIHKMELQHLQYAEIKHKSQKIEDKNKLIEDFNQKYISITDINKEWEQNIKKILQLFLKFMSFSFKLLPEQTTFLLDLERMLFLQLSEMQKNPSSTTNILKEEWENNIFKFDQCKEELPPCIKDPFVLIGDLSDPIPKQYGSQETLPSDVDLPYFRLGRQYVYAKCHGFESIKKYLDSQKCKCRIPPEPSPQKKDNIEKAKSQIFSEIIQQDSSFDSIQLDDFERVDECPVRKCKHWIKEYSFPNLTSYLDYSEENFRRVTSILDSIPKLETSPNLIHSKDIANSELPFSATKEPYHSIGTQCSSEEDLSLTQMTCPCIENVLEQENYFKRNYTSNQSINNILAKRKTSLEQLIHKNPNLLNFFTDESFDYKI